VCGYNDTGCVCRICVVTLANAHPAIAESKKIAKVEFTHEAKVSVHLLLLVSYFYETN